jgi:hypothetical protein
MNNLHERMDFLNGVHLDHDDRLNTMTDALADARDEIHQLRGQLQAVTTGQTIHAVAHGSGGEALAITAIQQQMAYQQQLHEMRNLINGQSEIIQHLRGRLDAIEQLPRLPPRRRLPATFITDEQRRLQEQMRGQQLLDQFIQPRPLHPATPTNQEVHAMNGNGEYTVFLTNLYDLAGLRSRSRWVCMDCLYDLCSQQMDFAYFIQCYTYYKKQAIIEGNRKTIRLVFYYDEFEDEFIDVYGELPHSMSLTNQEVHAMNGNGSIDDIEVMMSNLSLDRKRSRPIKVKNIFLKNRLRQQARRIRHLQDQLETLSGELEVIWVELNNRLEILEENYTPPSTAPTNQEVHAMNGNGEYLKLRIEMKDCDIFTITCSSRTTIEQLKIKINCHDDASIIACVGSGCRIELKHLNRTLYDYGITSDTTINIRPLHPDTPSNQQIHAMNGNSAPHHDSDQMSTDGDAPQQALEVAVPAVFRPPPQPAVQPTTLLRTEHGIVRQLPEAKYISDQAVNIEEFRNLMMYLECLPTISDIKYQRVIILGFDGGLLAEPLFDKLIENGCDIVGVNCVEPNVCSAICRRTKPRSKLNLDGFNFNHIFTFKDIRGKRTHDFNKLTYSVLNAWLKCGTNYKLNFDIMVGSELTLEGFIEEWANLTDKEVERIILEAEEKVKVNKIFSDRDQYIATMGRKILTHRQTPGAALPCVFYLDGNINLLSLNDFVNLDLVKCKTFDVITGAIIQFEISKWFSQKYFKDYTLVIMGDSSLGKTALAMTLASLTSDELKPDDARSYFIKVETMDALREAYSNDLLHQGVPIVFDEIEPGKMKGTRKGSSIEDVKLICEVSSTTTIHARYRDIVLNENQPRIFTSNSSEPHGWHADLPKYIFNMDEGERAKLDAHVKAVFKRCCFAVVSHSLITEEMRRCFNLKRRME